MRKFLFAVLMLLVCNTSANAQTHDLDYYINQAMANSPLLKDYTNQYLSGIIDSQRLKATYKPQVSATSANTYAPIINGYGYDQAITNIGGYSALLNVDKNFIGRKNIGSQYAAIHLQNDSIQVTKRISEQDLKRTVTAQYITAYGDLQQLNFNMEVTHLLSNEDTILRKLTQSNVYKQTDYLTFKVTELQQQLQQRQLRIQYQTDYANLNYLCGIYDTSAAILSAPDISVNNLPDLTTSVFFRKYVIDSLRLQNSISILNYSYHPKLNAYVNGGWYSSLLFEPYKNFGVGFGLNLSVPIYDGNQRRLQYRKIKLQEDTRANYEDFFIRQYNQQIAQLMQQLKATEQLIAEINDQVKYTETLIKVDGKQMQTGDTRIADYVIAINNYLTTRNLLTQNSISRMQIITQINYWNR